MMPENVKFDIDKNFKKIGEFGYYQLLVFVLIGLTACIPALIVHSYPFITGTPDFRCQIPELENDTYQLQSDYHESLVSKYIPVVSTNPTVYDKCNLKVYKTNTSIDNDNSTDDYTKQACSSWVFSQKFYKKTIATDWKLVCDKATKKSTFSSLYFIGTYGVIFIGVLSDKYGRKFCAYVLVCVNLILMALVALVTNIEMGLATKEVIYSICRFFAGTAANTYSIAVVLAIEVTGPTYRVTASNVIYYFYILGEYISTLLCYFVRDYDTLYIYLTGIFAIYPIYFWLLPESPRWLLAKGRTDEAYTILKRIAKSNGRSIPESYDMFVIEKSKEIRIEGISDITEDVEEDNGPPESIGFLQTLYTFVKSKALLLRTISIAFNWLTNNLVYYGLTLGAGQLAGDPYLNFALLATTELFAILCTQYAYEKIGRKIPYIVNMAITSVVLLVVYFVPKSISYLITIIALIGKFTVSFTFGGIYIVTSELYPTLIRQTTLSMCQIVGKLGAIIAPYINLMGELYFAPLPFMIYGACAALATILTFFFVPETKNRRLPNTVSDIS